MARKPMHLDLDEGALHEEMHVPEGKGIPTEDLEAKKRAAESSGDTKLVRQTTFALNARKWHHGGKKVSSKHAAEALERRGR